MMFQWTNQLVLEKNVLLVYVLLDFLVTVKVAPHECVNRTGQP